MATTLGHPRLRNCLISTVSFAAFSLANIAEVAAWSITDLGTLGGTFSIATGINNLGQVVGYSPGQEYLRDGIDTIRLEHGFISAPHGGPLTDLGPSPADVSIAKAVNNAGRVVGEIELNGSMPVAMVTGPSGAPMPSGPFEPPYQGSLNGGALLQARDINNAGQVLGSDVVGNNSFLTRPDGITLISFPYAVVNQVNDSGQVVYNGLDNKGYIWSEHEGPRALAPEAVFSTAVDINNHGQVVGRIDDSGYITGPNGGAISLLDTLGGAFTQPVAINNLGQVIGQSSTPDGLMHAFVTGLGGKSLTDLETLDEVIKAGWSNLTVAGINDAGQIAGTGFINGRQRAFFLSPMPEPTSSALMLSGLIAVQEMVRRRRNAVCIASRQQVSSHPISPLFASLSLQ